MSGAVSSATGSICTQVGPGQYCRTPYVLVPSGVINPATGQSEMKLEYGTPQYSSVPCGTGSQAGDAGIAVSPVEQPSCSPPLASYPLSALIYTPEFDPGCGLFYSNVYAPSGGGCPNPFVWAAAAGAAEWTSTPPPSNSSRVYDLYQFPLQANTPKWVTVGDGIFKSVNYGDSWEKLQDWRTTPLNLFYVSVGVLVGFQQVGTTLNVLVSSDDGKSWAVNNALPDTYLDFTSILASFYILPPWIAAPGNGVHITGTQRGVSFTNPNRFGCLVTTISPPVSPGGGDVFVQGFMEFELLGTRVTYLGVTTDIPQLGTYAQNGLIAPSPSWGLS